mmetsp:Transcript_5122/g.11726  ORF Transcript_5122/g.11726 Transcript_5122/m.11726 type:complete len:206 (+) Transcript_5122:396-1013(+)
MAGRRRDTYSSKCSSQPCGRCCSSRPSSSLLRPVRSSGLPTRTTTSAILSGLHWQTIPTTTVTRAAPLRQRSTPPSWRVVLREVARSRSCWSPAASMRTVSRDSYVDSFASTRPGRGRSLATSYPWRCSFVSCTTPRASSAAGCLPAAPTFRTRSLASTTRLRKAHDRALRLRCPLWNVTPLQASSLPTSRSPSGRRRSRWTWRL